jgi:heterodisulfide reductase subunit B
MGTVKKIDLSYFPGCSLATRAKESNESLMKVCEKLGLPVYSFKVRKRSDYGFQRNEDFLRVRRG